MYSIQKTAILEAEETKAVKNSRITRKRGSQRKWKLKMARPVVRVWVSKNRAALTHLLLQQLSWSVPKFLKVWLDEFHSTHSKYVNSTLYVEEVMCSVQRNPVGWNLCTVCYGVERWVKTCPSLYWTTLEILALWLAARFPWAESRGACQELDY